MKPCGLTRFLPIFDAENQSAEIYLSEKNANRFAEVTDTYRLHDLLHRDEYRPVAAIRFHRNSHAFVRVYFQQLHDTQFDVAPAEDESSSRRTERYRLAQGLKQ